MLNLVFSVFPGSWSQTYLVFIPKYHLDSQLDWENNLLWFALIKEIPVVWYTHTEVGVYPCNYVMCVHTFCNVQISLILRNSSDPDWILPGDSLELITKPDRIRAWGPPLKSCTFYLFKLYTFRNLKRIRYGITSPGFESCLSPLRVITEKCYLIVMSHYFCIYIIVTSHRLGTKFKREHRGKWFISCEML